MRAAIDDLCPWARTPQRGAPRAITAALRAAPSLTWTLLMAAAVSMTRLAVTLWALPAIAVRHRRPLTRGPPLGRDR